MAVLTGLSMADCEAPEEAASRVGLILMHSKALQDAGCALRQQQACNTHAQGMMRTCFLQMPVVVTAQGKQRMEERQSS